MEKITILGGGAWGTSIANTLAEKNNNIIIWSNEIASIDEINNKNTNSKYLNGLLSKSIKATDNLEIALKNSSIIFIILPSNVIKHILIDLEKYKNTFKHNFIICTKGIDSENNMFFSDMIENTFPVSNIAVLSGPNFAEELFIKNPTITTIATESKDYFNYIKNLMNCLYLNLEYFNDMKAVQLCGLIKNVTAILCGIAEGLSFGRNTFAAIVMKGLKEIESLCTILQCNERVIGTSAGVGDLVLTCGSLKSRNMNFGYRIGCGENIKNILSSLNSTVEGLINAKSLAILNHKHNIKNSVADILLDIINNDYTKEELKSILIKNLI